jgi:RimJ/RimL family protein N-acetyltransferase
MADAPWNPQPTLIGPRLTLRPLHADDFDALYAVASDPLIWAQHPAHNRHEHAVFRAFVDDALAGGSAFVAVDNATGTFLGSSRYHGYDAAAREVEVGWTFLSRACWGGTWNHEMKRLMLDHAFQWVDRVLFNVGPNNIRSQRAVERIGGRSLGLVQDAARGDRVVFEIRREEWAVLRERLG